MNCYYPRLILLFLCASYMPGLFAQPLTNYTPYTNDSLQLVSIKNDIRKNYLEDSASISGENKKQLIGIYRDRYQNLADMFKEKEFMNNPEADGYLQNLVAQIINSNPQLKKLGTRFLFSRVFWPNAFSSGEGTIVFNIGLFAKLNTESEVVFTLCHELAHLYLDHSTRGILQYVNTVNSKDFQEQLKEIKKSKYEVNKQLEKLEKGLVFKSRRHGREHEDEADSVGLSFMQNTGYNIKGSLTCLAMLDVIDKDSYAADSGLQRNFNFTVYPFNKKWLKKEEGFFGGVPDKAISTKEKDSLKTHPDCKARIAKLTPAVEKVVNDGRKDFLVSETQFNALKSSFKFEVVEFCFVSKRISRCLYYALEQLETNPNNAYLVTMIGKCFNEMYSNQKAHTLNRVVDLPSPYADKNYDVLTQFIQNISLGDMAAIGYYFLNNYKTVMAGDAGFEKALATSTKNFNNN
ncbi:MAG: M48 family metalloprotease [Chitinophagaceae bacterium]|nr:M48 family metalloprotease [Chitinophagaceae bacterium]